MLVVPGIGQHNIAANAKGWEGAADVTPGGGGDVQCCLRPRLSHSAERSI